jgi:tetraacyldisaccharide 4'-kinase
MTAALESVARRAWAARTPGERALRAVLVPAALAYGAVASLRNRLYDRGWLAAHRVPAQVLSVGNITVGGTGKTPATLWLAQRLSACGRRTGIVTRGYRKRRRGIVIVGEAGRALVGPAEGGDEAVMLARRFSGPVVAGERRARAAAFACARFALDTVVLDDGFQHRSLARDADLVLAGDEAPTAWPLPAGPLREPADGLGRARAVLAVDAAPPAPPGVPLFRGTLRPRCLVRLDADGEWVEEPLERLRGRMVTAVAGVARPARFADTLARAGVVVRELLAFPDHHAYGGGDVARIAAAAGGGPVVTTEKDLVKLERLPGLGALCALRVELEVEEGDRLLELLTRP